MAFLLLLYLAYLAAILVDAYKILVYSPPVGYSHMQFMGRIADVLHDAGHDVTVLHQVGLPKYLHAVSASAKQLLLDLPEDIKEGLNPKYFNVWDMGSRSAWQQISMLNYQMSLLVRVCDLLLGDNQTIEALRNENFDAGMTELMAPCGIALFSKVGINHMIGTSSVGLIDSTAEFYDAPRLPSFVPSYLVPVRPKMNFLERTLNFVVSLLADVAIRQVIIAKHERVFRRHGITGDENKFYRRTNYFLSNSDEFLENARPISAKIVHIGGIALPEIIPLTSVFKELMERKDRTGVVYISFGSVVPTKEMPKFFREAIIHVAETFLKITFIWKIDKDDFVPELANLHAFSWLPQRALLDHPNLLCFVSHAGLNSVLEVAKSGKPSILVPIFGDQFRNARLVEAKNTTVIMFKENFNNHTFEAALRQALSDQSLAARARRLASLMNNKPFPIKERLISTVEFSIRHGKIENLDSYGRNLNTLQYYSIDVIAFLSFVTIISAFVTVKLCISCIGRLFSRKSKVD